MPKTKQTSPLAIIHWALFNPKRISTLVEQQARLRTPLFFLLILAVLLLVPSLWLLDLVPPVGQTISVQSALVIVLAGALLLPLMVILLPAAMLWVALAIVTRSRPPLYRHLTGCVCYSLVPIILFVPFGSSLVLLDLAPPYAIMSWIPLIWHWVSLTRSVSGLQGQSLRKTIVSLILMQIALVLFSGAVRLWGIEAFKIPGESMAPTVQVGDHLYVTKYRYGLASPFSHRLFTRLTPPQHGDVVIFIKPTTKEQGNARPTSIGSDDMAGKDFLKRIIGLPGDRVERKEEGWWVNGQPIPRCEVAEYTRRQSNLITGKMEDHQYRLFLEKHGEQIYPVINILEGGFNSHFNPTTVPKNQVFVLGDNRDNSNDSRYWGSVPIDNLKGRASYIWWANRRPHGMRWDRMGTEVMNPPPPEGVNADAWQRCKDHLNAH